MRGFLQSAEHFDWWIFSPWPPGPNIFCKFRHDFRSFSPGDVHLPASLSLSIFFFAYGSKAQKLQTVDFLFFPVDSMERCSKMRILNGSYKKVFKNLPRLTKSRAHTWTFQFAIISIKRFKQMCTSELLNLEDFQYSFPNEQILSHDAFLA